ncbi:unnamed protein product [Cuscuta campestris]|uniref:Glycolipid transfer protein domain-containing protein n=2 Tax=Cuscuta sect. Cleistogrammica TaxID=1824901 RepID=A0A484NL45_9ASTE|nr:hypothetical protein DM860_012593 [Cuscuta australis]VFR02056.1 unnamed protein product [Cuscuta campestris]
MEGTQGNEGTIFTPALEKMEHIKSENGEMLTEPFLEVCKLILPVIDKFGAAMAIVKTDIGGNIKRLEENFKKDPKKYAALHSIVKEEVEAKTATGSSSCTNGLLWLTRAMDFLVKLFRNLLDHAEWTMTEACQNSYSETLKKFHGWFASSAFTVAMKLAPERKKFMEVIGGTAAVNNIDIENFCKTFSPFLEENHTFLKSVKMNELKA